MAILALVALLACASAPSSAAGAARPTCAKLTGRHLGGSHGVRVVERGNGNKGTAYVCVPPRGRVWSAGAASSLTGGGEYSITVSAIAGPWVALKFASVIGIASSEVGKVIDAATGRSFRFISEAYGPGEPGEIVHIPERVQLNSAGQMALALAEENTGQIVKIEIIGFQSNGQRRVLDSGSPAQIPTASLTLKGSTAQWTDAGATRTATL